MLDYYLQVISGEKRGPFPFFLRQVLRGASFFYSSGVMGRLFLYRQGLLPSFAVTRPVISVGNITAGGSGKTPFVELLARLLKERGEFPLLLSRGYHPLPGQDYNDEALLLEDNLPQVPHLVGRDRVANGQKASRQFPHSTIILDDGFQHLRLERDLNILLVDSLCPFGYGRLLPAGLLREPLAEMGRAHLVGLTRSNQQSSARLNEIEREIRRYCRAPIIHLSVRPRVFREIYSKKEWSLSHLQSETALAFCGLGNPLSFWATLKNLGINTVEEIPFPDHYHYRRHDLEELEEKGKKKGASVLVTTQKDGVKLREFSPSLPVVEIQIKCEIERGREILLDHLSSLQFSSTEN